VASVLYIRVAHAIADNVRVRIARAERNGEDGWRDVGQGARHSVWSTGGALISCLLAGDAVRGRYTRAALMVNNIIDNIGCRRSSTGRPANAMVRCAAPVPGRPG